MEAVWRYHLYVGKQPFANADILDHDFKQRIVFLAGWRHARSMPGVVSAYMATVKEDYRWVPPTYPLMFDRIN
jgi:hypothetical protein